MKTLIKKVKLHNFRNKEHWQFIKLALDIFLKYNPDALNIRELYNELDQLANEEQTAISVELGSAITVKREAADLYRDRMHSKFYHYVLSFILDDEEAGEFEAAQRVMRIIRQVGNPWKLADHAETTMLIQLGNELQPYSADLEMIGAQSRLDKLLAANLRFVELDKLCRDDRTNRPSGSVKAVRVKVDPTYTSIIDAINSDVKRYKDDRFDLLITDLNAIVKDYSTLLAQRKSRTKKVDPAEKEPNKTGL